MKVMEFDSIHMYSHILVGAGNQWCINVHNVCMCVLI